MGVLEWNQEEITLVYKLNVRWKCSLHRPGVQVFRRRAGKNNRTELKRQFLEKKPETRARKCMPNVVVIKLTLILLGMQWDPHLEHTSSKAGCGLWVTNEGWRHWRIYPEKVGTMRPSPLHVISREMKLTSSDFAFLSEVTGRRCRFRDPHLQFISAVMYTTAWQDWDEFHSVLPQARSAIHLLKWEIIIKWYHTVRSKSITDSSFPLQEENCQNFTRDLIVYTAAQKSQAKKTKVSNFLTSINIEHTKWFDESGWQVSDAAQRPP